MSQVIDGTGLTADDVVAIRGTFEAWRDACVQRDWDALLGMCTDDIVFLPPGESPVEGAGVRGWLDSFPVIKAMSLDIDRIEGTGHLAGVRGLVRMTLEVSGQQLEFDGKYTDLFRKQPNGRWLYALVMWNSNKPA